jgi:hypothetical protein
VREIALVLAIGNLVALNLLVVGVLVIAYRNRKVNVEMESPWPEFLPLEQRTLPNLQKEEK